MTSITRLDVERLAKVFSLFSSDVMGERAAAAHKANEIIKAAGLRWEDVLKPAVPAYRSADPRPREMTPEAILERRNEQLTEREEIFLKSLTRWRGDFTPEQKSRLEEICKRFAGSGR